MRVAAILIVKGTADEAKHLRRCLLNITPFVDHVFLNINVKRGQKVAPEVLKEVRKYHQKYASHIVTTWRDDFAAARNDNLAQVTDDYDWIIWLDADDTVDKPGKIRKVAELSKNYDSIFVDYLYDHDEEQNPLTVHLVARMFKNNGANKWQGRIHETLVETRGLTQGATKDFMVVHHSGGARTTRSYTRNIKLLEKQINDEKKSPDPRTFFYLASTYMDSEKLDEALSLFQQYLTLSGWDQERSVALTKMGRIYLDRGDKSQARTCFANAHAEDPANPDPRVELGSLEYELRRYDKALLWLEPVEEMEKNMTTLERNPMSYTFRTYLLLAECYLQLGGKYLEKAVEYSKKALRYKKKNPEVKAWAKMVVSVEHDRELTKNILQVYRQLKKNKEKDKMNKLLEAVPKQLDDNPVFVSLRQQESFKWPAKSVAIMTGDTMIDAWGPWSLKEGIGGSEEAIIRMSRHLTDLGYHVVVFAKPENNAGLDDHGVMWRNFWEINLKDEFDIFIGWRGPYIFDREIKARKKYLWLHDVMEPGEFTADRLSRLDKVIVLSKYHRSLFPMIPDEKILLSGNGIDPEDFQVTVSSSDVKSTKDNPSQLKRVDIPVKRDPHKIFYGSSHVRGLAYLYEIWEDVKKAVPQATLDVYYGRESYDAVHKGNPERMKWMDDLMAKAKSLKGVTDHGKVSQSEINQHIFESGVWAYPCPFPEIYCITAIKAQAGGAVPVSSSFAALEETVQFGVKLPMAQQKEGVPLGKGDLKFLEAYKSALIDMLKNPKKQEAIRPKMMKWARAQSWLKVAEQWVKDFDDNS